jgi:RNA polymerase sigma-70 factor (ECF subfamily)
VWKRRSKLDILRVIKIDQTASHCGFTELIEKYGNSIYRFCRSLTYSKEDADDLFQETFLKAFEQFPKLSAADNPQSFLFSASLYIWKGWKRKYARRKRLAPEEPLDESIASRTDMEDHLMTQEENRMVREAVKALPDKFKIPIVLHYTIEMSVSDIASILRLPAGTVKSRLFKARRLVEKELVKRRLVGKESAEKGLVEIRDEK